MDETTQESHAIFVEESVTLFVSLYSCAWWSGVGDVVCSVVCRFGVGLRLKPFLQPNDIHKNSTPRARTAFSFLETQDPVVTEQPDCRKDLTSIYNLQIFRDRV